MSLLASWLSFSCKTNTCESLTLVFSRQAGLIPLCLSKFSCRLFFCSPSPSPHLEAGVYFGGGFLFSLSLRDKALWRASHTTHARLGKGRPGAYMCRSVCVWFLFFSVIVRLVVLMKDLFPTQALRLHQLVYFCASGSPNKNSKL